MIHVPVSAELQTTVRVAIREKELTPPNQSELV